MTFSSGILIYSMSCDLLDDIIPLITSLGSHNETIIRKMLFLTEIFDFFCSEKISKFFCFDSYFAFSIRNAFNMIIKIF